MDQAVGESRWIVAKVAAILALCAVSGLFWAYGAVAGGLALDGVPDDSYEAPMDFGIVLVMLVVACPVACLAGYFVARVANLSPVLAMVAAQVSAAVLAGPAFLSFL